MPVSPKDHPSKDKVKQQFGQHAAAYVTSTIHAKGKSLSRLVKLIQPQPDWVMLDIATGAGHTAITFAPFVTQVIACDITPQMLEKAAQFAQDKRVQNIQFELADAETLPYDDGSFDLVTCRIAPHHFIDVYKFIKESARVLRKGGTLAVADNIVPSEAEAAKFVNYFEKLRDPSHGRCLSIEEWEKGFTKSGFHITHQETLSKRMDFEKWTGTQKVPPDTKKRLRDMLQQAPDIAADFLDPQFNAEKINFQLWEGIFIGLHP